MAKSQDAPSRISLLRVVPGSIGLSPLIRDFCRRPNGVLTAFSDSALALLRRFVSDEDAVEVRAFGDVVRLVLELSGEPGLRIAGGLETLSALDHACRDVPEDSPFRATARFPGFHEALGKTLSELHAWEIDADAMQLLALEASPRLSAKLNGLSWLDRTKDAILYDLGRETHSRQMQACLEGTFERDGGMDRLFVLIGSEEYPLRVTWLKWLASQGVQVTAVVDRHATEAPIFRGARRTLEQFDLEARDLGEGLGLVQNLFCAAAHPKVPVLEGGIAVESAADPLAEVEWALRACAEEPEGSAIYVRNLEDYAPLIDGAARRLEVPIRMARRAPLLTNSFARLTLSALEALAGHDVRALIPILKSSYLGLSGEAQNRLLSAIKEAHQMRTLQWETLRLWTSLNPEIGQWVAVLLEWRSRALGGQYKLREWKGHLDELIDHPDLPWSIRREAGHSQMAERDRRARNQMQRLLANMVSVDAVTAAESLGLREIVDACRRMWDAADVSIPTADFGVLVTDQVEQLADANRLHVLGMLEGVFPRRRSEDPILTDDERAEISSLRPDRPRLLNSHDRAAAERDAFYRVVSAARRTLVFSYPEADDQRDNIPAFYLFEVERAARLIEGQTFEKRERSRLLLAPPAEVAACAADRRLREAAEGPRAPLSKIAVYSGAAKAAVRAPEDHGYSPSELRDALLCSFQYAFRRRLQLPVHRRATRWHSLTKLPQVAGLMTKGQPEFAEGALIEALEAELDALYSEVDEWELNLLRAGGRRLIREWLRREFASRRVWPKDAFVTNVSFGDEGLRDRMPGGVRLEGRLPGISRFRNYNVAHLYRSAPSNAKSMSEAERLFVGLHLLALHEPYRESAIEFDSMSGKRELLLLTRSGGTAIGSSQDGLTVVDLSTTDDPVQSRKEFFVEVKSALRKAVEKAQSDGVEPQRGEHCGICGYAELCRRSQMFSEEDSLILLPPPPDDA